MLTTLNYKNKTNIDYPGELVGSWTSFVFFDNHPKLDGICCIYFNERFPSGTICVSNKILNDYPDIYATWNKPDKDGNIISDRMSVSRHLRNLGLGKTSLQFGAKVLKDVFDKTLIHKHGSASGNKLWKSAFGDLKIEDLDPELNPDLQEWSFDQPAFPYIFLGKRVVGIE
jgi:hypothetical protein